MGRFWRKGVTLLALYALALHVILLAFSPVSAADVGPLDPFAVICHTIGPPTAPGKAPQGTIKYVPGRAGDFCNVCGAAAPPPAPDTAFLSAFEPARVLHVLRPVSAPAQAGRTCDPNIIRGPPFASL